MFPKFDFACLILVKLCGGGKDRDKDGAGRSDHSLLAKEKADHYHRTGEWQWWKEHESEMYYYTDPREDPKPHSMRAGSLTARFEQHACAMARQ